MSENLPDIKKESMTPAPDVVLGFGNAAGFAMLQRAGTIVSEAGEMIPAPYRKNPAKCAIALEMANRIGAHFLAVMQNLYDVYGQPAWSAQFMIAAFNATPGFSKLRYRFTGEEGTDSWTCQAWAIETATGEELVGSKVSISLAKAEGWHDKKGSKWKTMPMQMLMYRAAAWFVRAYAPELTMGIQTREEVQDTYDMSKSVDGSFSVEPSRETSDILTRASQPKSESPASKTPKVTQAMREEAAAACAAAGINVGELETEFGAYARSWSYAQCQEALARAASVTGEVQDAPGGFVPSEEDLHTAGELS